MQTKWLKKIHWRQLFLAAVWILAIFVFSKLVVFWAIEATINGKIVGSNFFRSNAFTWRYADMDKKLQITFSDVVDTTEVTAVVNLNNDLWREKCEQENCTLRIVINEEASRSADFVFAQQQENIVVENNGETIKTLDFELLEVAFFHPWNLNYISANWAVQTNLLNSSLLEFSDGFTPFEDWNQNPALSTSQYLVQWDGLFYQDIAENGYSYNGNYLVGQNIAWPPLWPLLWAGAHKFLPNQTWSSIGVALNLGLSLLAFTLLYKVSKKLLGEKSENLEFLPPILLAFSPFAVFLTATHSEALFIVCLLAFVWSLLSEKRCFAAIFLCLAGATRTVAVPLAIIFWLQTYLVERQKITWKNVLENIALSLVSVAGFLGFLIHVKLKFGTPFLDPLKIQQAWHYNVPGKASLAKLFANLIAPLGDLKNFILNPYYSGLFINLICVALALWVLISAVWALFKKRDSKLEESLVLLAVIDLILLAANFQTLLYQANYTLGRLALPAYAMSSLLLAVKLKQRRGWLVPGVLLYLAVSAVLYFWYAISVVNGELPC